MRGRTCVIALLLLLGMVASGCATQESRQLTFYWISRNAADPFMGAIMMGAEERATELGVEVVMLDARDDAQLQLQMVDQVITLEADGVFINPVEGASITPGIQALNEAGIPVIALGVWPVEGQVVANMTTHGERLCRSVAEGMVSLLEEQYGTVPDGVVLGIMGRAGDAYNDQGVRGFEAGMAPYPQLEVVWAEGKYDPSVAFEVTSNLMTRYGDRVVGVFMRTDCMSPGVISAIQDAGYDPAQLVIVSSDGQPSGLDFLRQGMMKLIAPEQPLGEGILAVQLLYNAVTGGPLPVVGEDIVEEGAMWSPVVVIEGDTGPILLLNGPLIPRDISVDDPRNWGNIVGVSE